MKMPEALLQWASSMSQLCCPKPSSCARRLKVVFRSLAAWPMAKPAETAPWKAAVYKRLHPWFRNLGVAKPHVVLRVATYFGVRAAATFSNKEHHSTRAGAKDPEARRQTQWVFTTHGQGFRAQGLLKMWPRESTAASPPFHSNECLGSQKTLLL